MDTKKPVRERAKTVYTAKDVSVLERIFYFICNHFQVDPEYVKSKTRKREAVFYRHVYAYMSRMYFQHHYSLSFIGSYLGKDHSTVIHSYRTIEDLCQTDKRIAGHLNKLRASFERTELPNLKRSFFRIPKNDFQKERHAKLDAIQHANRMYYECIKHMKYFNEKIMSDRIIEGHTRSKLNKDYWKAYNRLEELKYQIEKNI